MTRNSTMRPSGKRYLHHCSFRSEKNQRTEDKLITLMRKVCCQLSPFSHTQERRDPYTNFVRANENQVAKWKTKESGFSLKDKKSKFSLKLEQRFQADSDRRSIQELNGIIDVLQEKRIDDCWNVDANRRFLERIHEVRTLERETSKGKNVVRGETNKHSSNYQT